MNKKQRYKWLLARLRGVVHESRKESKQDKAKKEKAVVAEGSGTACAPRVAAVDYVLPQRIDTLFKAASTAKADVCHGSIRGNYK